MALKEQICIATSMVTAGDRDEAIEQATGLSLLQIIELRALHASAPADPPGVRSLRDGIEVLAGLGLRPFGGKDDLSEAKWSTSRRPRLPVRIASAEREG